MRALFILLAATFFVAYGAAPSEPAPEQPTEPTAVELASPSPTAMDVPPTEAPPTNTPEPELTAEERGREIFYNGGAHDSYTPERSCSSCHSLDGTVT